MPIAVILSVILALAGFSAALLLGVWLVRRFALPQELPEDLLFDAPPPAVLSRPDRTLAREAAARQGELARPFAQAKILCRQAQEIRQAGECWAALDDEVATPHRQACERAKAASEAPLSALQEALQSREAARIAACCEQHGPVISAAHAACAEARSRVPPADNRKLWLLLALLVLAIAFQFVVGRLMRGLTEAG
jgi:hypothetical protein